MSIYTVQEAINAINAIYIIDRADDIVDKSETYRNLFTIKSAIDNDISAIDTINKGIDAMTIDNGHSGVNIAIENAITMNNNRVESATQILTSCSKKEMTEHMKKTVSYIKKNLRENLKKNLEENVREFIEQIRNTIKTNSNGSKELEEIKGAITWIRDKTGINTLFSEFYELITSVLEEIKKHENDLGKEI